MKHRNRWAGGGTPPLRWLPLLICLWATSVFPQGVRNRFPSRVTEEEEKAPPPAGPDLMRAVRAQLPVQPIRMAGFIRTRRDGEDSDRRLISELRFGDRVPRASYRLFDALGAPVTRVEVTWPGGVPSYAQWDAEGAALPEPDPADEVADTGLTWSDLSLSFLWWPGAEVVDSGRVKTRASWVVRIPAPASRPDVDHIRLWVDKKALFIVKAELLDADGDLLKRIEVDSIKEIREDVWMVKDLLIRDKRSGLRMGIRFQEVEELEPADE